MPRYLFESVAYKNQPSVNAFVASIRSSAFHWHYPYEVIFVLKGDLTMRVESDKIQMSSGDLLLINSRVMHSILCEDNQNLCGILQLAPSLFEDPRRPDRNYLFYLNSSMDEGLAPSCGYSRFRHELADVFLDALGEKRADLFHLRADCSAFIADLFTYAEYDVLLGNQAADSQSQQFLAILEYIRTHLQDPQLTLSLCHAFGMSNKTVYRLFKTYLGTSAKEYIDESMVYAAKQLLTDTDQTMTMIQDACGFGSEKTFYRMFQKITGQTPGKFREGQIQKQSSGEIREYLDFEPSEAKQILIRMREENGSV